MKRYPRWVKWVSLLVLVMVFMTSSIVGAGMLNPAKTLAGPYQGLTPGYWKNHVSVWDGNRYSAGDPLHTIFSSILAYPALDVTLLEALNFHGGPGFEGAARILLRAAVAAILNANYYDYPVSKGDIQTMVNDAISSGDRETILGVAEQLDEWNNLGNIPDD